MTESAASTDPRSAGVMRSAWRVFALCLAIAVVMGVSGAARGWAALGEWTFEATLGAAVGLATARWLVPRSLYERGWWTAALMIGFVVAAPVSATVLLIQVLRHRQALTLGLLLQVTPAALGVSLVMTAMAFLVRRPAPSAALASGAAARESRFLARLPPRLKGAELYAVESEDHYLRLHTSLGQDLILMRLADATAELAGSDGAQTHRSWWVARAGVASAERLDGRAELTLKDGAKAPVSRAYAKALREAGWF